MKRRGATKLQGEAKEQRREKGEEGSREVAGRWVLLNGERPV